MKTIGIFTEGGAGIGLGHLMRCYALAYALEKKGYNPIFFIFFKGDLGDSISTFEAHNCDWKVDIESIIKKEQLSFAIIDSYLASQEVYDIASRLLSGRLLAVDDYARLIYPKSLVINPSIYAKTLDYPVNEYQRYFLGKDYIMLRPDFWEAEPKKIKDRIENVFLTLGGLADKEILEQIALFIKKHIDAHVRILDSYKKQYSAKQMRDMMSSADLCVSGGGQTMYELARMGVPTISVTLNDNQIFNAKGLQEAGFSFSAGRINEDFFFDRLKEGLEYMGNSIVRKQCSAAGQRSVDGKGVHRLAEIVRGVL